MRNIRNFGAYAIILEEQMARSLKKVYEVLLTRIEDQIKNVKFISMKYDEVTFRYIKNLNAHDSVVMEIHISSEI